MAVERAQPRVTAQLFFDWNLLSGDAGALFAIALALGGKAIFENERARVENLKKAEAMIRQGNATLLADVKGVLRTFDLSKPLDGNTLTLVAERVRHVIKPFRRRSDDSAPPPGNNDKGGGGGQKKPSCSMTVNLFTQPAASGPGGRVVYNATVQPNSNGSAFVPTRVEFSNRVVDPVTVPPMHALERRSKGAPLVITPTPSSQTPRDQPAYFTESDTSTMAISAICSFAAPNGAVANLEAVPTASVNGRPANATVNNHGTTVIRIPTR